MSEILPNYKLSVARHLLKQSMGKLSNGYISIAIPTKYGRKVTRNIVLLQV